MIDPIVGTGFTIAPDHEPFIIAELSGNHGNDLERALKIVDRVAEAGAHALKLQTYTADTMTIDCRLDEFIISAPSSPWFGRSLYDLYEEAHTPWEWHPALFERARERGLVALSTPFDPTAVDLLESLEAPLYKIASFEITDIALIKRVAQTGKPIIISTGMASEDEIALAVASARAEGNDDVVLLKCTSSYPAPAEHMNLATITRLRELFNCHVGLSDHTLDDVAAISSVALGAVVVEKHVTLDRSLGGVDSAFSLEPDELHRLVCATRQAWLSRGNESFGVSTVEKGSVQFRRSLYVVNEVAAGEPFTHANVRAIRPGFGLPPSALDSVLGKQAATAIARGTALAWNHIAD